MGRVARVVGLVLCAAVFGADAVDAQYFGRNKVRYDQLDFQLLQTEHFDIYYYAEEAAATREAGRMAERWYARFSRLFGHTFTRRQPLVLYASHPHFSETNLTAGSPGEGTGGFTERTRSRIAMPFAAGLGETEHVLGHEIAHAFQIDIAKRAHQDAFALPGWVIEGMAEYLSLGPANVNTDMWIRDAAQFERLPTVEQLSDPRYFPYRYGHAFWSYLAGRYGDGLLGEMLRSRVRGVVPRLEAVTGEKPEQLSRDWHDAIAARTGRRGESDALRRSVTDDEGRIHVGPALSPDGRRIMYLSERDRLSMDLFMADAATGRVLRKIVSTAADPHFDSLQYIYSSGAWDPAGHRFAITAVRAGEPVLVIVDIDGGARRREIPLRGVDEVYTPSWSPDGSRLVFSALKGGLSDLFIVTLGSGEIRQVTADSYADLHPTWSLDGHRIAFTTDRFTSDIDTLRFGAMRVGLLDLDSGRIEPMLAEAPGVKQVNPQWAPGDRGLYFVSDRDGISNVYRWDLATQELRQVTTVGAGVSGITAISPSLSVATQAGTLAFSVYRHSRFEIRTLDESSALSARMVPRFDPARTAAPVLTNAAETTGSGETPSAEPEPSVAQLLADSQTGLSSGAAFSQAKYDDRLRLESVSQPYIGASTGNGFGGILRTTLGFTFGDVLRDRQLQTAVRLGTSVDDLALQVAYVNRREQWNWGVVAGVVPSHFYGARRSIELRDDLITRETSHLRYMHEWAGLSVHYNLSRVNRVELGASVRRTGLDWQRITRIIDPVRSTTVSRELTEEPAGRPLYLGELQAAFVHDTSVSGPLGPLVGERLRLDVQPGFGGVTVADVHVDARKYFMPMRPVTIATRIEHLGRYGRSAADPRLTPLVVGLQTLVRGYDLRTFAIDQCGRSATECSVVDELTGSRLALMNVEVRAPLPGLFSRQLSYSQLPIEALAFVDAGFLWTRDTNGPDRDRFRSAGAGARVNLGGIVLEMTAARPFDRAGQGWTASVLLRPGW